MVDIIDFVFKRFSSQQLSNTQILEKSSVLVVGDESINRSVLLLVALTAAADLGFKVLFFTQSQIQSLPKTFNSPISNVLKPDCLKKIKFVYPKTLEELLEDVASLHELVSEAAALPSLIMVDGLERYMCDPAGQDRPQREAQSAAAHVVALLHDTATFLTQKLDHQAPCRVIVSIQPEWTSQGGSNMVTQDPLLAAMERYLQVRCSSEKVRSDEGAEEWSLCLSGPGLQVDGVGNVREHQWRVILQPSGSLEFCPVGPAKEETSQEVKND